MTPQQEAKQLDLLDAIYCALLTLTVPKPYNVTAQTYNTSGSISSGCMDMIFINSGTNIVTLNTNIVLSPGGSFSTNANYNEVDKSPYICTFAKDSTGTLTNVLTVVKKVYI